MVRVVEEEATMDNREEIFDALNDFEKKPSKEIPPLLEQFLRQVAKTGETLFPWPRLKPLFVCKLNQAMAQFHQEMAVDHFPGNTNMENVKFDDMHDRIINAVERFHGAPFTIQRLCELITEPKRHYQRSDKYLRGIEKNVLVVSTVDPFGRKVVSESRYLVNGLDTNGCQPANALPLPPVPNWAANNPGAATVWPHTNLESKEEQSHPNGKDEDTSHQQQQHEEEQKHQEEHQEEDGHREEEQVHREEEQQEKLHPEEEHQEEDGHREEEQVHREEGQQEKLLPEEHRQEELMQQEEEEQQEQEQKEAQQDEKQDHLQEEELEHDQEPEHDQEEPEHDQEEPEQLHQTTSSPEMKEELLLPSKSELEVSSTDSPLEKENETPDTQIEDVDEKSEQTMENESGEATPLETSEAESVEPPPVKKKKTDDDSKTVPKPSSNDVLDSTPDNGEKKTADNSETVPAVSEGTQVSSSDVNPSQCPNQSIAREESNSVEDETPSSSDTPIEQQQCDSDSKESVADCASSDSTEQTISHSTCDDDEHIAEKDSTSTLQNSCEKSDTVDSSEQIMDTDSDHCRTAETSPSISDPQDTTPVQKDEITETVQQSEEPMDQD